MKAEPRRVTSYSLRLEESRTKSAQAVAIDNLMHGEGILAPGQTKAWIASVKGRKEELVGICYTADIRILCFSNVKKA